MLNLSHLSRQLLYFCTTWRMIKYRKLLVPKVTLSCIEEPKLVDLGICYALFALIDFKQKPVGISNGSIQIRNNI